MHGWFGYVKSLVLVFLLCVSLVTGGCEGTETRDKVDESVEEMAGKKKLDRYQKMKDDLSDLQTQQTEKYRQLGEEDDDK